MFNKLIGKRVTRKPSKTEGGSDSTTGGLVTLSLPAVTVPKEKPASLNGHFPLTSFRDVAASERPLLLLAKLDFCCLVFEKDGKDKETKRQTLVELTDYLSSPPPVGGKLTDAALPEFFRMVSANLFRDLPPPSHESTGGVADSFDIEEDEPTMDPSWPHLQIVYELLLRYVVSPEADPKTAKKYIDQSFIIKLLALFDSEDPRERDYLKTVLHRIYGKFMVHRPFIRKAMTNVFYRLVFETERYNGTAELLEILGSIINGFALPLKEEHKLFLARVLIPLHKPKCVASYHQQLSYCVTQFVEKDFKLADTVIRGLLRFWPLTNSQKEVLFLGELEVILEATQATEFQRCMIPLFRQISRCLNSPHFQVAERTLFLWNNDHILTLVSQNRKAILPLIFGTLEKNAKSHWNKAVHALTINARKMFMDMDPELFEDCQKRFLEEEAEAEGAEERRATAWKRLETLALSKASIADPIDTVLEKGKR